jgi:glycosyltransferase involved in cell wall biosynthesis
VSVIVPVRDRRALLRRLLDALAAQTHRDFEVVVVDDGSVDGSGEEAAADAAAGRAVRVVASRGDGAVDARRTGVAAARANVLAFTDSDCEPVPEWLAAGLAAIGSGADLAHGPTLPVRPVRPLERSVHAGAEGLYPSCNLFVRRAAYERVGGFDGALAERLGFRRGAGPRRLGFGEDTVLAWRVRRQGGAEYVPDAIVHHHVSPPSLRETARRAVMAGAFPALVTEIPELRATLVRHRIQLGSRSRLPFYATTLALVFPPTRRTRLPLTLFAWWVASRGRELAGQPGTWGERTRALPAELMVDALTGGALVLGSVRAGTALL